MMEGDEENNRNTVKEGCTSTHAFICPTQFMHITITPLSYDKYEEWPYASQTNVLSLLQVTIWT